MDRPSARRPLPALAFLLALSLLTALVWWRVIHRADSGHHAAQSPCTAAPTTSVVPQASAVKLRVLNATQRNHLAQNVAGKLGNLGFHVTGFGNDASGVVISGVAEIRYGSKGGPAATLVSFYLPGARMVQTESGDSSVEVSLGNKFRAVATTAQAKQTMARQHVTQAPAKPGRLAKTPTPTATPTSPC